MTSSGQSDPSQDLFPGRASTSHSTPAPGATTAQVALEIGWTMAVLFGRMDDPATGGEDHLPTVNELPADQRMDLELVRLRHLLSVLANLREFAGSVAPELPALDHRAADFGEGLERFNLSLLAATALAGPAVELAYQLGRSLRDTANPPLEPSDANPLVSALARQLSRGRVARLQEWLAVLASQLPQQSADVVAISLGRWSEFAEVALRQSMTWTKTLRRPRWRSNTDQDITRVAQDMADYLLAQGDVWKMLLVARDTRRLVSAEALVAVTDAVLIRSRRMVASILKRYWAALFGVAAAAGGAVYLAVADLSGAAMVWAIIGTIVGAISISVRIVTSVLATIVAGAERPVFSLSQVEAMAWASTTLPQASFSIYDVSPVSETQKDERPRDRPTSRHISTRSHAEPRVQKITLRSVAGLLLEAWSALFLRQQVGRAFGLVSRPLPESTLRTAIPPDDPPIAATPDFGSPERFDGQPGYADRMRRPSVLAARWATAIYDAMLRSDEIQKPSGTVLTTVGFVEMRDGLRLAVIHYVRPLRLLRSRRQPQLEVAGSEFPVVIRPWLLERHGLGSHDGHCWVQTSEGLGVLTAKHSIRPKRARVGTTVSIAGKRSPITGKLFAASEVLDAAVVVVGLQPESRSESFPYSATVGFHKVRLETGHGASKEARVTEWQGFTEGVFSRSSAEEEPLIRTLMTFSAVLDHGDSGCLVVDIEGETYDHLAPYLMYQGAMWAGGREQGYGLFIAQAAHQWGLETCRELSAQGQSEVENEGADSG
jgi:hypothetical protein